MWKQITDRWHALGALAGSFAAGGLLVMILGGFIGLPAQHEADVAALDARVVRLENALTHLDILVCIITNEHLDRPVEDCVE